MAEKVNNKVLRLILIIVVIIGICSVACNFIRGKIEQTIAQRLTALVGPADSYKVTTHGPLLNILRGQINAVNINGEMVKLSNGIIADQMDVKLTDVVLDVSHGSIVSVNKLTFSTSLSETTLSRYLNRAYPDIVGIRVSLPNDNIAISAEPKITFINARLETLGKIRIVNGNKLMLDTQKIRFGHFKAPKVAYQYIERKMNPLFDMADLGLNATLTKATIKDRMLVLAGRVDLQNIPKN